MQAPEICVVQDISRTTNDAKFTCYIMKIDKITQRMTHGEFLTFHTDTFDEAARVAVTICDALNRRVETK